MRPSRIISLLAALVLTGAAGWADPPRRVVSINLCTNQLALALAAPGQLVSVTRLAQDPGSSALHDKARALPTNGSGAEEVYLLNPDLVLAGSYTDPVTLRLMRDLGIRVERFEAAATLDDIPALMAQMGAALGREAEAAEAIAAFRTELNLLRDTPARRRGRRSITSTAIRWAATRWPGRFCRPAGSTISPTRPGWDPAAPCRWSGW